MLFVLIAIFGCVCAEEARLRWGQYHPNLLGGISEAKTLPLAMRLLVEYDGVTYYKIKDTMGFDDFVQAINHNNGMNYSENSMIDYTGDRSLDLQQHFIKHKYEKYDDQAWTYQVRNLNIHRDPRSIEVILTVMMQNLDKMAADNDDYLFLEKETNRIIVNDENDKPKGVFSFSVIGNVDLNIMNPLRQNKKENWDMQFISSEIMFENTIGTGFVVRVNGTNDSPFEVTVHYSDRVTENQTAYDLEGIKQV